MLGLEVRGRERLSVVVSIIGGGVIGSIGDNGGLGGPVWVMGAKGPCVIGLMASGEDSGEGSGDGTNSPIQSCWRASLADIRVSEL